MKHLIRPRRRQSALAHKPGETRVASRDTCWACGKKIKPDGAPRALCAICATGGGLGPYT